MKKIIGMIGLALLLLLSACNNSSSHDREEYRSSGGFPFRAIPDEAIRTSEAIIGTWDIYRTEEHLAEIAGRGDDPRDFFYTFNADGTGEMQNTLMDEPVDLSWEIYDDILIIERHTRAGRPQPWDFGVVDDALYLLDMVRGQSPRFIRRD